MSAQAFCRPLMRSAIALGKFNSNKIQQKYRVSLLLAEIEQILGRDESKLKGVLSIHSTEIHLLRIPIHINSSRALFCFSNPNIKSKT